MTQEGQNRFPLFAKIIGRTLTRVDGFKEKRIVRTVGDVAAPRARPTRGITPDRQKDNPM